MTKERDRGERPKKSWRELDAQRDGRRSSEPRREGGQQANDRSSSQHKAALDALFEKGGFSQMAEKLTQRFGAPGRSPELPKAKPDEKPETKPEPVAAPEKPKDDQRVVLKKKLLEAVARDEISRVFDRYTKLYGMPNDFELLEQGLEHQKLDRQGEVLAALEELLGRDKPKRSKSLAGKLRYIEETGDDPELRVVAARIRARLG